MTLFDLHQLQTLKIAPGYFLVQSISIETYLPKKELTPQHISIGEIQFKTFHTSGSLISERIRLKLQSRPRNEFAKSLQWHRFFFCKVDLKKKEIKRIFDDIQNQKFVQLFSDLYWGGDGLYRPCSNILEISVTRSCRTFRFYHLTAKRHSNKGLLDHIPSPLHHLQHCQIR